MEVEATTRYVRLSPRKGRDLVRAIKGLPLREALAITRLTQRKAAFHLWKTLRSAQANAENNQDLDAGKLFVKEAVIQDGPRLRRWWPRARGMASPIRRRLCHIRVVLTDEPQARGATRRRRTSVKG
ncbi:MAG: 50S ribosomal protein L22 [Verrucomicrobia bacterium]|nr:MAG: 50S ribosomal protein L22 [Verrucomicrobiota bacterium]